MIKVKVILDKVKIKFLKHEIKSLLKFIELIVIQESNSKFDIANIHASWLASLKEIAAALIDKDLTKDFDKKYKVSLTQSQYFALLELYQHEYPLLELKNDCNCVLAILNEFGINNRLIKTDKYNNPIPLLEPISQQKMIK